MGIGIYLRLIVILFVSLSVVDLAAANIIQCGSPAVASLPHERGHCDVVFWLPFFVYFFFFRVFSAPVLLVDHFWYQLCAMRGRNSTASCLSMRPLATSGMLGHPLKVPIEPRRRLSLSFASVLQT